MVTVANRGWFKLPADLWPSVVAGLQAAGRPWPDDAIRADLHWWDDQMRFLGRKRPGRPTLRKRWGNPSDYRVKGLLKAHRQLSASGAPGQDQPTASESPAQTRSNAKTSADSASRTPANRQEVARTSPENVPTRVETDVRLQTQTTDKTGAAGAAGLFGEGKSGPKKPDPGWEAVEKAYVAYRQASGVKVTTVKRTSGQGKELVKLVKAHTLEAVLRVLRWLTSSQHGRAPNYRENRRDSVTIRRHWAELWTDVTENFPLTPPQQQPSLAEWRARADQPVPRRQRRRRQR